MPKLFIPDPEAPVGIMTTYTPWPNSTWQALKQEDYKDRFGRPVPLYGLTFREGKLEFNNDTGAMRVWYKLGKDNSGKQQWLVVPVGGDEPLDFDDDE